MTSAGDLNRRITIVRATTTRDEHNEPTTAWSDLATLWAAREDISDGEMIAAGELGAYLGARFTVRRDSVSETVTARDRISHEGAIWSIQGPPKEKREAPAMFLEIRAAREG